MLRSFAVIMGTWLVTVGLLWPIKLMAIPQPIQVDIQETPTSQFAEPGADIGVDEGDTVTISALISGVREALTITATSALNVALVLAGHRIRIKS